ncbi:MAG: O-acetyl-ADP-ribose deacetylase [Mucilaginibacter sp.]|jgi:O-acetyl-ADP-ribose deacetylase (regulator of RNase III)|uniref:O-acetyl-ADP-ribose deacetylase n=1 Tax=Mucilaginibacter sp. TaxID=1882438 RepID=UPI003563D209
MDKRIKLQQGDITKLHVDAIVNAANSSLMGGGGVDGAIHRAGGKQILEECLKIIDRQGSCKTGQAVITTGGKLPAKHVIHTVGPVWNGGKNNESQLLANCYTNSLNIAVANNLETIAFPNISTGVYRFPKDQAAQIALKTVNDFLHTNQYVNEVFFICFDDGNYQYYAGLLS